MPTPVIVQLAHHMHPIVEATIITKLNPVDVYQLDEHFPKHIKLYDEQMRLIKMIAKAIPTIQFSLLPEHFDLKLSITSDGHIRFVNYGTWKVERDWHSLLRNTAQH